MALACLAWPPMFALAQADSASASDTAAAVFARARQLVVSGNGAAGRALVDSLVSASAPGSKAYGEALYWRASLAASAADAERDYTRVIVEYPFSPHTADALYALAQLESSRGERTAATTHLERLLLEYPDYRDRSRAGLRLGQLLLDQGRLPRGCAVLLRTRAGVPASAVELRNQLDYSASRCVGVDTAAVLSADSVAAKTPAVSAGAPPTSKPAATIPATAFSVQVAAFQTRREAERLQAKLRTRGFAARVVGSAKPFRVRVGRYATRADAATAARRMKAKGIAGFVTTAEAEQK